MRYVSTESKETVGLRQAVEQCYGPDGGLYLPERFSVLPRAYFNNIEQMSLTEIAYVVMSTLLGDHLEAASLKDIVEFTFNFPMPVEKVADDMWALEMFNGPTLAFKDVGARFLAAFIDRYNTPGRRVAVLVATTGNTGSAVANALGGSEANVFIMFPRGTLSRIQQAQLAVDAPNIHPIEVYGSIAQCKAMAKEAMMDLADSDILPLCANTQNVLRILPQVVFFFQAYARLKGMIGSRADGFTVSVPCGNLSNLVAAVIARRMGLPMGRIVAGCNANDDFVRVLDGSLSPEKVNRTARPTLAWAMDTGYPINLNRLIALYDGSVEAMRRDISAVSIDDRTITDTINNVVAQGYTPDPHTAVAIAAARQAAPSGVPLVVLATSHPAKSLDKMTAVTGRAVELPLQLTRFMSKPKPTAKLAPTYAALKKYIFENS